MALVLNEMLTNAVEHGLSGRDGTIEVSAQRRDPDPRPAGRLAPKAVRFRARSWS